MLNSQIVTPPPAAPVPAVEQPTLIQQANDELARLREARFQLAAQSQQYHSELIAINGRLREPGVELDEVQHLQGRRAAITQANATLGSEDERLERALNVATDQRAALLQERQGYEHLQKQLKGEISDQRVRQQNLQREAELAGRLVEQAEAQLQHVTARLAELGASKGGK